MTVHKNDDVAYGKIRYRRQTYPKAKFVLNKGTTIASDDTIKIIGNYTSASSTRTVVTGTDGAPSVGTDNFISAGSTFSTSGIVAGDMLIIEDGDDIGSYIVDSVDSETQLSLDDHAGDPVSFTGDTGNTFQVGKIIFNGRIESSDYMDAPTIEAESIAQEIDQIRPTGDYSGLTGGIVADVVDSNCTYVDVSQSSDSGNIRPNGDDDVTGWSQEGGGDHYEDIDDAIEDPAAGDGVDIYTTTNAADCTFDMTSIEMGEGAIVTGLNIKVYIKNASVLSIVHATLIIGGDTLTAAILDPLLPVGEYDWKSLNFTGLAYNQDDLDGAQLKLIHYNYTTERSDIDAAYVVVSYTVLDDIDAGSNTHAITLEGDKTITSQLNLLALNELKVWYLDTDLNIYFNDADVASGATFAGTDNIKGVRGKRAVKSYDKVVLYGGYVDGTQLTSTSGEGNIIWKDRALGITVQAELDTHAAALLTEQGANHYIVQLMRQNTTDGLYQVGETIVIGENSIKFDSSSTYIPNDTYILNKIDYIMTDGAYNTLDIELIDGLIFSTPKEELGKEPLAEENSTGLSQVTSGAAGLQNIVEDTTPQLGGELQANGNDMTQLETLSFKSTGDLTIDIDSSGAELLIKTNTGERIGISDSGVIFGNSGARVTTILDEDNMVTDSATALATQQSIKKYVDDQVATKATDAEAHAYVEANALTLENDLTMGNNNIITGTGTVDGKDVSGLCTTAEAHAYIEANALTLTATMTTYDIVLAEGYSLKMDGTPTDDKWTGITLLIDTTDCVVGDAVYVDNTNSVLPADADDVTKMPAIGVVVAAGVVLTHGVYRDDSVFALAKTANESDPVFVSTTAGDLTLTPPSGADDIVQVVGILVGPDMVFVNPSLDWVKVTT